MNQDLPKPMLDALARQTLPTDHPPADVLTAFAENALAGEEYRRTADHLARCGECREVVFLSVGATDKALQAEEQVAAAHGTRRTWMPRLVWGASIAAAVLMVASGLMLRHRASAPSQMQMASREIGIPAAQPTQQAQESQPETDSKIATAPQTTTEIAMAPAVTKIQPKTARAKNVTPKGPETLEVGANAGIVAGALPAPTKTAPATTVAAAKAAPTITNAEPSTITIGNAAPAVAPAAPHANSFAAVQGGPVAEAVPGSADRLLLSPQSTARAMRAAHPQWRITADGHLEHLTSDGWSRVMANQTATFRVVSVVGNHVWVGGSGGALFHSRDDGQTWTEVTLTTPNGRETATIGSIQFDDALHGTVTTDTGTRCTTADGGGTWNCEEFAADEPQN